MIRGQGRTETDEQKTGISLLKTENGGEDGRRRRAREKDHDPRVLEGILGIMARKEEDLIGIRGTVYTAYEIHNQTSQHTIGKESLSYVCKISNAQHSTATKSSTALSLKRVTEQIISTYNPLPPNHHTNTYLPHPCACASRLPGQHYTPVRKQVVCNSNDLAKGGRSNSGRCIPVSRRSRLAG